MCTLSCNILCGKKVCRRGSADSQIMEKHYRKKSVQYSLSKAPYTIKTERRKLETHYYFIFFQSNHATSYNFNI